MAYVDAVLIALTMVASLTGMTAAFVHRRWDIGAFLIALACLYLLIYKM
jgi:hypothetical protein